jgi:hypothetical protein
MLGKSFSCEVLVTVYSRFYLGVCISIQGCTISCIAPFSTKMPHPSKFSKQEPNIPNICTPRGKSTQLFMGYSSWQEITHRLPDVIAPPYIILVIKILFPKITASLHVYF